LKSVHFRYLVNSMQNQMRSTNRHLEFDRSINSTCWPLDGSILLKFLLETRLKSESFDTLDDFLRFQVLKV